VFTDHTVTSRSGSGNGRGVSSTPLTTLKIETVAPMPSASVPIAASEKPGWRMSVRAPKRRSRIHPCIVIPSSTSERAVRRAIALHSPIACQATSATASTHSRARAAEPSASRPRSAKSCSMSGPNSARNPLGSSRRRAR
jgi:hypothetical protein